MIKSKIKTKKTRELEYLLREESLPGNTRTREHCILNTEKIFTTETQRSRRKQLTTDYKPPTIDKEDYD